MHNIAFHLYFGQNWPTLQRHLCVIAQLLVVFPKRKTSTLALVRWLVMTMSFIYGRVWCIYVLWPELRAVFSVFDVDRDGFITVEEVFKVLDSMGFLPSPSSIDDIFRQVDLDGSKQLLTLSSEHISTAVLPSQIITTSQTRPKQYVATPKSRSNRTIVSCENTSLQWRFDSSLWVNVQFKGWHVV